MGEDKLFVMGLAGTLHTSLATVVEESPWLPSRRYGLAVLINTNADVVGTLTLSFFMPGWDIGRFSGEEAGEDFSGLECHRVCQRCFMDGFDVGKVPTPVLSTFVPCCFAMLPCLFYGACSLEECFHVELFVLLCRQALAVATQV